MTQAVTSALSPAEMVARIAGLEAQLASLEICQTCAALPCVNPNFCEVCERADRQRPRQTPRIEPQPTPQCMIEAILYCVRERGVAALHEPANLGRLKLCDAAALAQIDAHVAKLKRGGS
jgi:hypothetical protein